jgi:DNA-binding FadR family transcriptional regulator
LEEGKKMFELIIKFSLAFQNLISFHSANIVYGLSLNQMWCIYITQKLYNFGEHELECLR